MRIERVDDVSGRRGEPFLDGGPAPEACPSAVAVDRTADHCTVHVRHRAPGATAVALRASGWWWPDPCDGLDLEPRPDGSFSAAFRVPADWCTTFSFAEHRGADAPPWWRDGLKGASGGAQRILDLTGAAPPTGPVPRLADLASRDDGEPRVRWFLPHSGGSGPNAGAASDPPRSGAPPALLIVTDGEGHIDRADTPRLLRAAAQAGALPPTLVLFIDAWPDRAEHLGVPGGQARWIAETLVPRVRGFGAASADARRTAVAGSSFGGLTALFAVARAPATIGAASIQSASLWRYREEDLLTHVSQALPRSATVRLRMHAGRFEGTMADDARSFIVGLRARTGRRIPLHVHSGGHDWAWWRRALVADAVTLLS